MKLTCKKCRDTFEATKYEKELIAEGLITMEEISLCNDCFEVENDTSFEYEQFSDADPGL
jgi:hypothetical protein